MRPVDVVGVGAGHAGCDGPLYHGQITGIAPRYCPSLEGAFLHGLDFGTVPGLSAEIWSRHQTIRPEALGQAGLVSGVSPAALLARQARRTLETNGV